MAVTEFFGLIQSVQMGLFDVLEKNKTRLRFLTTITKENFEMIKSVLERLTTCNANLTVNHVDLVSGICPHFIIKDDEEAIIFLPSEEDSSLDSKHAIGIWTDKSAVFYAKPFFEELWHKSMDINKKFLELEAEKMPRKAV